MLCAKSIKVDCGNVLIKVIKRECWFCQKSCSTYVEICMECIDKKMNKKSRTTNKIQFKET